MGIALNDEDLRRCVKEREVQYKQRVKKEVFSKFIYVCRIILPTLINAIFDSTVRHIALHVVRPEHSILTNNCYENKRGQLKVSSKDMLKKAIYFEELYREWD